MIVGACVYACVCVCVCVCHLRVIYALLQSDWLAQNVELEPQYPANLPRRIFPLLPPPTFALACAYTEKLGWVARLECVCVCVCVCVCGRVCARLLASS